MLSWVFGKPVFAGLLLVPFVEFLHRMTKLGIELASGWLEWMNIFVGVCQDWAMTDMTLGPRQEVDLLHIGRFYSMDLLGLDVYLKAKRNVLLMSYSGLQMI